MDPPVLGTGAIEGVIVVLLLLEATGVEVLAVVLLLGDFILVEDTVGETVGEEVDVVFEEATVGDMDVLLLLHSPHDRRLPKIRSTKLDVAFIADDCVSEKRD